MFKTQSFVLPAPGASARILEYRRNCNLLPYVSIENKDDINAVTIEHQESDDGTTWSTIVGSTKIINAGEADGQIVSSSKPFLAVLAAGNVTVNVLLFRQYKSDTALVD